MTQSSSFQHLWVTIILLATIRFIKCYSYGPTTRLSSQSDSLGLKSVISSRISNSNLQNVAPLPSDSQKNIGFKLYNANPSESLIDGKDARIYLANDINFLLSNSTNASLRPSILSTVSKASTNNGEISKEFDGENLSQFISPEIAAILMIYFVQGAIGLSRLAVSFFMKDTLHLSPSDMAAIQGINILPWVIKPLYGFLSDSFPLFGYKRRSYLILTGLIGCLSWVALGTVVTSPGLAIIATTIGSASIAISDVVADSLAVEKSRSSANNPDDTSSESKSGELQSLCWAASAFGGVLSAYFSGYLLQVMSLANVFFITALFPLLISVASFFIREERLLSDDISTSGGSTILEQFRKIFEVMKNPGIYLPVFFIFLWQATPSAETAMFYFTTNELKFSPEFLGKVRLIGSLASLAGVFTYRTFFKDVPIKSLIKWTTIISVPLSLTQMLLTSRYNLQLGIPDQIFALTETSVLTALGQLAFMPTLVLAASLCPPGVEGTLFATLMSIYNAAGSVSSETGAALTSYLGITETNFDNLSLLVFFSSVSSLLPLLFLGFLDKTDKAKNVSETS